MREACGCAVLHPIEALRGCGKCAVLHIAENEGAFALEQGRGARFDPAPKRKMHEDGVALGDRFDLHVRIDAEERTIGVDPTKSVDHHAGRKACRAGTHAERVRIRRPAVLKQVGRIERGECAVLSEIGAKDRRQG